MVKINFPPEKLYIIGNGFDLHHHLKCRYDHFKNWLQIVRPNVYANLEHIYGHVCNSDWWKTFEESLACFDPDKYPNEVIGMNFFKLQEELVERYGQKGREVIDTYEMENEAGVSDRALLAEAIARFELIQLKMDLFEAFGEWVRTLVIPSNETPLNTIDTDAMFFTFNYTRTLEDLYGVDEDNILHLHGSVDNGKFVIGHNLTAREMNNRDLMTNINHRDPDADIGEDLTRIVMCKVIEEEMRKPVNEIMDLYRGRFKDLVTIKQMTVLGFSYSPIDLPYLRRIFEITGEDISVEFGWHTDNDKTSAKSFAKEMELSHCKLIPF